MIVSACRVFSAYFCFVCVKQGFIINCMKPQYEHTIDGKSSNKKMQKRISKGTKGLYLTKMHQYHKSTFVKKVKESTLKSRVIQVIGLIV